MPELQRILALPKREYTNEQAQEIAKEITRQFKTSDGTQTLRNSQGVALYEFAIYHGLFGALYVGSGKTLITLLAPTVTDNERCLLLLPAALLAKTERDKRLYAQHWKISKKLRLFSYEMLGRTQSAKFLEQWRPDLIIADECHRLKNTHAAVTKRVARYMKAFPDTHFIAVSGTVVRKSIKDYAHLLTWTLKDGSPLPQNAEQLEQWAEIIDENENFLQRRDPGELACFGLPINKGYRERLIKTPGVLISQDTKDTGASLLVRGVKYDIEPATQMHFKRLREEWVTPDGWQLADPLAVWRHARELALGLHYIWDPRPPEAWREARRAWAAFCRNTIIRSRVFDSEKQVADAVLAKLLVCPEFWVWNEIKRTFEPNEKPVWHSAFGLNVCEAWIKKMGGGIIWSVHSFFGRALSKKAGLEYFGRGGVNDAGRPIEETSPKKDGAIVVSIPANGTGRNLQAWKTSLVTAPPSGGDAWEQLLGRLHRSGQLADEVLFDVLCGCKEHIKSMEDARKQARMIEATLGTPQKLLYCDYDFEEPADQTAPQWN